MRGERRRRCRPRILDSDQIFARWKKVISIKRERRRIDWRKNSAWPGEHSRNVEKNGNRGMPTLFLLLAQTSLRPFLSHGSDGSAWFDTKSPVKIYGCLTIDIGREIGPSVRTSSNAIDERVDGASLFSSIPLLSSPHASVLSIRVHERNLDSSIGFIYSEHKPCADPFGHSSRRGLAKSLQHAFSRPWHIA